MYIYIYIYNSSVLRCIFILWSLWAVLSIA